MEKVCKYFLILMLFVFCLLVNTKSVNATTVILKDSSGNYYYDYSSKLSSTYYQSLEGVLQEDFRSELHNIISSGEIKKYSYSSVTDLLKELAQQVSNEILQKQKEQNEELEKIEDKLNDLNLKFNSYISEEKLEQKLQELENKYLSLLEEQNYRHNEEMMILKEQLIQAEQNLSEKLETPCRKIHNYIAGRKK